MDATHSIAAEFRIRYQDGDDSFVIWSNDPRFGETLRLYASPNPESANYNPQIYNRLAQVLRDAGKRAPEHDVPEADRRLGRRP